MSMIRTSDPDTASPRESEADGGLPGGHATAATPATRPVAATPATVRERQREEFGGVSWLSTLVGWLAAAGLAAILTGILGAAGAVLAVSHVDSPLTDTDPETIGVAGGIALLVVLAIAYFFGGYAAGRMARFDGARQGVGVWVWGIVAALVIALLAVVGGSQYNVLDRLNLPRIPVDSGALTQGGLVALLASVAVTLGAAMLGGKAGERFHRKVDRVGAGA
jgi:amino acid transporter